MDGPSTKRLFRAIAETGNKNLLRICEQIAEAEDRKGHAVLSKRLKEILTDTGKGVTQHTVDSSMVRNVASLGEFALSSQKVPKSRRFKDPLVQLIPREQLRHHIVLARDIQERYERIVKEFAARHRLAKHGLKYKRKILIYGPPGCGKTLSAEYLAWHTGLPLIKVRFDALISSFFGESAANLRHVFEWASDTPSVLFLDECDFIAKSRASTNDIGEVSRLVNTLLMLLEEYDSQGLLLAATNLTSSLDTALFRRFDEVFEVSKPGKEEIVRLLELTLASMKLARELDVSRLADQLSGLPASSVVLLSRDVAASAVLDGRNVIGFKDFEAGLGRLQLQFLS